MLNSKQYNRISANGIYKLVQYQSGIRIMHISTLTDLADLANKKALEYCSEATVIVPFRLV